MSVHVLLSCLCRPQYVCTHFPDLSCLCKTKYLDLSAPITTWPPLRTNINIYIYMLLLTLPASFEGSLSIHDLGIIKLGPETIKRNENYLTHQYNHQLKSQYSFNVSRGEPHLPSATPFKVWHFWIAACIWSWNVNKNIDIMNLKLPIFPANTRVHAHTQTHVCVYV